MDFNVRIIQTDTYWNSAINSKTLYQEFVLLLTQFHPHQPSLYIQHLADNQHSKREFLNKVLHKQVCIQRIISFMNL